MAMRRLLAILLLVLGIAAPTSAVAVDPDEILADPVLEERAREVSRLLRCVVCKSQSIDDSDAPLAKDLRLLVRERIVAGDSDEAALAYVVERYGDYVLLKPPVQPNTIALWVAPIVMLFVAGGAALFFLRRREYTKTAVLTAEEQSALEKLLE